MDTKATHTDTQFSTLLNKDQKAFDIVYYKYSKSVYTNIYKIVQQREIAEDILHEVFLALWENSHRLDPNKSIGGWLFVVSHNKALSYLKKKVKESIIFVESYDDFEPILTEELSSEDAYLEQIAIIEEAANHLSPRIREVYKLSMLEGNTIEEVAAKLSITSSSVKDYLKLSTRFMKSYIANKYSTTAAGSFVLILLSL